MPGKARQGTARQGMAGQGMAGQGKGRIEINGRCMDRKIFFQGLQMITANFNREPSKDQIRLYQLELDDLNERDYMAAILHLCRTREKIFPDENIVAIIRNQITQNTQSSAEEAWGKVLKKMNGGWSEPEFDDPKIKEAVKVLGWKTICATMEKDMNTLRAHFFRTYQAVRVRNGIKETQKVIDNADAKKLLGMVGLQIEKEKLISLPAKEES